MKSLLSRPVVKGWLMVILACCGGCGGSESADSETTTTTSTTTSDMASEPMPASGAPPASGASPSGESGQGADKSSGTSSVGALVQSGGDSARKIIYTAQVDLVVENLSSAQNNLRKLIQRHKGYVSQTDVGGESGSQRQGTWKVRVPVESYEAFMAGATRLGEVQRVHSDSQDVTAEYYDVAARIANKRVEEKRLVRHLQESTGKLGEILLVEKEISRVRGEIEQAQGRIRVLSNLSSLTTITLTMREIKNYVPPRPTTFASEVARSFSSSLQSLVDAGKSLLLLLVVLAPWLLVAALFALPARVLWRRNRHKPSQEMGENDGDSDK